MPLAIGSLNPGASTFPQFAAELASDWDKHTTLRIEDSLQRAAGSVNNCRFDDIQADILKTHLIYDILITIGPIRSGLLL